MRHCTDRLLILSLPPLCSCRNSHAQEDWLTLVDERAQSGEPFGIIMVLDSCASAESFAVSRTGGI